MFVAENVFKKGRHTLMCNAPPEVIVINSMHQLLLQKLINNHSK